MTLRVKPEQLGRGDELLLTAMQINRLKKVTAKRHGTDLCLSKAQTTKTALSLARPLLAPAAKALANEGLSFGAERMLKTIFGKGVGPQEIQLFTDLFRR